MVAKWFTKWIDAVATNEDKDMVEKLQKLFAAYETPGHLVGCVIHGSSQTNIQDVHVSTSWGTMRYRRYYVITFHSPNPARSFCDCMGGSKALRATYHLGKNSDYSNIWEGGCQGGGDALQRRPRWPKTMQHIDQTVGDRVYTYNTIENKMCWKVRMLKL